MEDVVVHSHEVDTKLSKNGFLVLVELRKFLLFLCSLLNFVLCYDTDQQS